MNNKEQFLSECIVLDTETTSLDFREAEVIEFGFVMKFPNEGWVRFVELHSPSKPITPEVSAVTNITNKMVLGKPKFEDAIDDLNDILGTLVNKGSRVAHNAFYDSKVLEKYTGITDINTEWLCTMRMAKKLYADDDTVTQFNLPYLRYRFELDVPEDLPAHRADADALVTALLLEHMLKDMEERGLVDTSLPYREQIEEWLNQPVIMTKMPFGKHKGKKLDDVPLDYWQWAFANLDSLNEDKDEFDRDFAASATKAVEKLLD